MVANNRPVVCGEHHHCNPPAFEVLLVAEIAVAGYEDLETLGLRPGNQRAVLNAIPPQILTVKT